MKMLVAFQSAQKVPRVVGVGCHRKGLHSLIKRQNILWIQQALRYILSQEGMSIGFVCKILDLKKNQKMKLQRALRAGGTWEPAFDFLRRKRMLRWLKEAGVLDLKWIIP